MPSPLAAAVATALAGAVAALPLTAQAPQSHYAWFGVAAPEGLHNPATHAITSRDEFNAPAVVLPADEPESPELRGERVRVDLATIVGFSRRSRERGDRLWGRVSGFSVGADVTAWAAEQFRAIGLADVAVQRFSASEEMWWPTSWGVTVMADSSYGPGTMDVTLASAMPTSGSMIVGKPIVASLVEVASGDGFGENFATIDVRGKIAVQRVRPSSGADTEREATVTRARSLMGRGAVGVLNVVEQAGNMHVHDFARCYGPCFNLGANDGAFLLQVIRRAKAAGAPAPRVRLALDAGLLAGLRAGNAVGVIPGRTSETIIINAHVDGWFDGAGDNGDGFAVMLALARHFARPENAPERTLVFVASAGHHSTGLNGPSNFVRMNQEAANAAVMVLNLEHLAQFQMTSTPWAIERTEQLMTFGISNESPFLADVARRGVARYGFRLAPEFTTSVPGELGGYSTLSAARVQATHAGPMFHTSGDVIETISTPGLERAARFFAYFLRQVDAAPTRMIRP